MHQGIRGDSLFPCPSYLRKPIENSLEGHSQLHLCNSGTQTFMHTMTKGQVLLRIVSTQIKFIRIRENLRVTVSCPIPKYKLFIFSDSLSV